MANLVSNTFRSVKLRNLNPNILKSPSPSSSSQPKKILALAENSNSSSKSVWTVYLILSTNYPIKTYVGVTTNFSRRLKQHNGLVKGGAKAARAGRPWISACIIRGFKDRSEACKFESKWKIYSRSMPRTKGNGNLDKEIERVSLPLLQDREAALNRMRTSFDFSLLEIDWKLNL